MVEATVAKSMFLQGLMSRKLLDDDKMDALAEICCQQAKAPIYERETMVAHCNKSLESLNLKIAKHMCESTGRQYYALVNDHHDPISGLAARLQPRQVELYTVILAMIINSDEGKTTTLEVLRKGDTLERKFATKSEMEDTIMYLLKHAWLEKDDKLNLILGARSHMEMSVWIRSNLNSPDAKKCGLCKHMAILGANCSNLSCRVRAHPYCVANFSAAKGGTETRCFKCKATWPKQYKQNRAGIYKERENNGQTVGQKRSRKSINGQNGEHGQRQQHEEDDRSQRQQQHREDSAPESDAEDDEPRRRSGRRAR